MLIGITPFNDETPELIFSNILENRIEWPQDDDDVKLSKNAIQCIKSLLNPNPDERFNFDDLKSHKLFESVNWETIINEKAPFEPNPDSLLDTFYFEVQNEFKY
jgi:serine/threonine protein kinase